MIALILLLVSCPMRTISTDHERLITAEGGWTCTVRVQVKDVGGTFRDLTTYPGENLVLGATWREDIDSVGHTAEVQLRRQVERLSVSPLQEESPLNKQFNPAGSYAALVDIGREIKIEWSLYPLDGAPATWTKAFHGYIDTVKFEGDEMEVQCTDLIAKLRDTWIEKKRVYAFAQGVNATKGCFIFEVNQAYSVGDLVIPSEGKANLHFYKCTTAGTTAGTEATWLTTGGSTTTQGTAVFTEQGSCSTSAGTAAQTIIQQIIDDHISGGPTLYVPTSPGLNLRWFEQDRMSVLDAVKKLAELNAWDIRYKWDNGSTDFRLTYWTPDRSKTTADRTWGAFDQPVKIEQLELDIKGIRNAVCVRYMDSQAVDADGNPTLKSYTSINSTSITNFGRRFMEAEEESNGPIDTGTEAQTFADNMCSDLALPFATHSARSMFFPFAELGDLYQYPGNDQHYSVAQKFAVTTIEHSVDDEGASTVLGGRGKVAGGYAKWLKRDVRAKPGGKHTDQSAGSAGITLTSSNNVGGTILRVATQDIKGAPPHRRLEFHISDSANFTPSSATLAAAGTQRQIGADNLIPGKTYYTKVVPVFFNAGRVVRGLPGTETSFVAGRGSAGHLKSEVQWGRLPLNGGFETQTDVNGPPDFWSVPASHGTWGTEWQLVGDANGISGQNYVKLNNVTGGGTTTYQLKTATFDVLAGQLYFFTFWAKFTAGSGTLELSTAEHDWDMGSNRVSSLVLLDSAVHTSGTWYRLGAMLAINSATKFMELTLSTNIAASGFTAYVDNIEAVEVGENWHHVGDSGEPSFANSWVNYDGGTTYAKAGFRRDKWGRIHLKGQIKSGTVPATIFTLPAGYRPLKYQQFVAMNNDAYGLVTIQSDGQVKFQTGTNAPPYASINGISFETF